MGTSRGVLPAARSALAVRLMTRVMRRHAARRFHAVRLAEGGVPQVAADTAVVVYSNHPSWWDPAMFMLLHERGFPGRAGYGPMEQEALGRYRVLERIGVFGLPPGARGARRFLRVGAAVLDAPGTVLWVTAEGEFADARRRPVVLRPGVAHLLRGRSGVVAVPLALEYPFWDESAPEALARFGPPLAAEPGRDVAGWQAALGDALAATMDRLADDAMARDPARFAVLAGGRVGVGGVYRFVAAGAGGMAWRAGDAGAPRAALMAWHLVLEALCWLAAVLALVPVGMMAQNLLLFRAPRAPGPVPDVSVVVPARNEAAQVDACLAALRASTGVALEIIVVDDNSADDTAARVCRAAAADARVRLHRAPPLPPGWGGKMHACHEGAGQARNPVLLFLDCDVRVAPGAVAAMAGYLRGAGVALASGFPRQVTGTVGEALLIPLIHVVLLGYLPLPGMRLTGHAGFGAGCGQVMVADAAAYRTVGGHAAIRGSWHDGLHLPREFRLRGYRTDIFDAAPMATCRMYRSFAATWDGLARNAHAGMATPAALPVWSVLLGGGMIAPFLLLPLAWAALPGAWATAVLGWATGALLLARGVVAWRFRQGWLPVLLFPAGVAALLAVQWQALLRPARAGVTWRGRTRSAA